MTVVDSREKNRNNFDQVYSPNVEGTNPTSIQLARWIRHSRQGLIYPALFCVLCALMYTQFPISC